MGSNLSSKHLVKMCMNHIHIFIGMGTKNWEFLKGIESKIIPTSAFRGTPTFVMNNYAACLCQYLYKSAIIASPPPPPHVTLRQNTYWGNVPLLIVDRGVGHCNDGILDNKLVHHIQFESDLIILTSLWSNLSTSLKTVNHNTYWVLSRTWQKIHYQ